MYRLKKLNVISLAYTVTLIYFILGIILGIFVALLKTNPIVTNSVNPDLLNLSYTQIILLYPIAYAAGGFIISIIVGYVYNLVAKKTGGVAIQLVKGSK